jgi:hypothetical protein
MRVAGRARRRPPDEAGAPAGAHTSSYTETSLAKRACTGNGAVLKTTGRREAARGFESHRTAGLTVGGDEQAEFVSASGGGRMSPNDRLPSRIKRGDGFCRYRTESLRDLLRADVVGRDQRDKPFDGSTLVCPFPDGRGCFGRISVAPVRPYQSPSKLGLSMTSCVSPRRGRPAACIENHETRLADDLLVGSRGLNNEGTEPVRSPSADPFLDDGSCFLGCRDGLFAQAMHDLGVREQVGKSVRVPRNRRA